MCTSTLERAQGGGCEADAVPPGAPIFLEKVMDGYESYETTTTLELTPETRTKAMNDFTDAFTALLQCGIRILFIGENLEDNELYFVCADPDLTFVNFLSVGMDEDGNVEANTIEISNNDFDSIYGMSAPIVIENCESFEDFLAKSGISVVPEE